MARSLFGKCKLAKRWKVWYLRRVLLERGSDGRLARHGYIVTISTCCGIIWIILTIFGITKNCNICGYNIYLLQNYFWIIWIILNIFGIAKDCNICRYIVTISTCCGIIFGLFWILLESQKMWCLWIHCHNTNLQHPRLIQVSKR